MRRFLALLRCIPVASAPRHARNLAQPVPQGYIRSQWDLPGYRVGWGRFGRVGCEITAVYNALLHLGKHVAPAELIRSFTDERSLMLGGLGGTDPFTIGPWLRRRGIRCALYAERRRYGDFCAAVAQCRADVYIVSYWTTPLRTNLHTVAFTVSPGGELAVHNSGGAAVFPSLDAVTRRMPRRFILGYEIWG